MPVACDGLADSASLPAGAAGRGCARLEAAGRGLAKGERAKVAERFLQVGDFRGAERQPHRVRGVAGRDGEGRAREDRDPQAGRRGDEGIAAPRLRELKPGCCQANANLSPLRAA